MKAHLHPEVKMKITKMIRRRIEKRQWKVDYVIVFLWGKKLWNICIVLLFWSLKGNSIKSRPRKAKFQLKWVVVGKWFWPEVIFFWYEGSLKGRVESSWFILLELLFLVEFKAIFRFFGVFLLYILCKFTMRLQVTVFGQLTIFFCMKLTNMMDLQIWVI